MHTQTPPSAMHHLCSWGKMLLANIGCLLEPDASHGLAWLCSATRSDVHCRKACSWWANLSTADSRPSNGTRFFTSVSGSYCTLCVQTAPPILQVTCLSQPRVMTTRRCTNNYFCNATVLYTSGASQPQCVSSVYNTFTHIVALLLQS